MKEFSYAEPLETDVQVSTVVNFPMQTISLRGEWERKGEGYLIEESDRADICNDELCMRYHISAD
jgi:hypothetical protein